MKQGQTIQWLKETRTDNAMVKRNKDSQYNGQKKQGQKIQWPEETRTDNTMVKRNKDSQYNDQKKHNFITIQTVNNA
jgi:hypothetical protein